ncbi:endolysin [Streptomyces phage Spilled]|uniref:Endolysin n=2 Tax=root TaxID=1 RepID=A0A5Q2WQ81_9CAUD|nr:endolysin [Streptomyces phage Birchlyn]QGH74284.1 endolysin [Streptomyces phage Wipeout]QGH78926.1 endolysin [Streptomyces phage TomSawyer]QGH79811.1 endolysin [Streptomyces phage Bordeaux]URM87568.1 endolysin [Streptomyces phage Quaran19]UVK59941.1 endolysin [Streptomyces phage Spilled]UVK60887.1 endolysin [Streptomyces phage JimJam]WPH58367.1 endolysin [Streptomyces phage Spelly]
MGQDMRGNIAAMALCLGVVVAVTAQAASDMGVSPLEAEKPKVTQSVSPEATPSAVVNSTSPSPSLSTIKIEPVAYSKSISSTKDYAKSKLKKKFPKSWKKQYNCLNPLWKHESSWNYKAKNPYSGAYGIPQSLPASKMKAAGKDWKTNPRTQVRWGLDHYIYKRYGTPCTAWSHFKKKGWY